MSNDTLFHVRLCSTLLCHHVNFHPKHAIFLTPQPRLYIPSMLEFLKKKFSTLINVQYQVSIEFANFEKKLIAAAAFLDFLGNIPSRLSILEGILSTLINIRCWSSSKLAGLK